MFEYRFDDHQIVSCFHVNMKSAWLLFIFVQKHWGMRWFCRLMMYDSDANREKATHSQQASGWICWYVSMQINLLISENLVLIICSRFFKLKLHVAYNCIATNLLFFGFNSPCLRFVKIHSRLHKLYLWCNACHLIDIYLFNDACKGFLFLCRAPLTTSRSW